MLTKVQNCPICKSAECREPCFELLVKVKVLWFKCNRKQEESSDIGLAVSAGCDGFVSLTSLLISFLTTK